MNELIFQYPAWYLLFCALLGLLYAGVLYYREKVFRGRKPWLPPLLGVLRFLAITLLSALLLAPLLKSRVTETKKPIVILAQDQSESIQQAFADTNALNAYLAELEALQSALGNDFEVATYSFGDELRQEAGFAFTDKATNISAALQGLYDQYSNLNIGAVILATDGIFNQGSNPLYSGAKWTAPLFTVALGDTIPKKDAVVKRVFHNQIAYLGDQFTVQADLAAVNCAGASPGLTIARIEGNQTRIIQQFPLNIGANDFFETREITLTADKPGVQRYRISLGQVAGEIASDNNSREFFVEVLDARQKILLFAQSPHPDLSAIKQALLGNKNYQVDMAFANNGPQPDFTAFDLVVFHQLPSANFDLAPLLSKLDARRTPRFFILGQQTSLPRFNTAQGVLEIRGDGRNANEPQAVLAGNFNLFTISEDLKQQLPLFVPLTAPFGDYSLKGNAQVFINQRIGRVSTDYPLFVFGDQNGVRTGVLTGEGIWRWRLFDYLQNQHHDHLDELLRKSVQYLSVQEDKRRFRVQASKNIFRENEPVILDGELYNESFELINTPDVSLVITDEEGRNFNYTLDRTSQAYTLRAGILAKGSYRFTASVDFNGQTLTASGVFVVQPVELERYETTANHGVLRLLSREFGGEVLYPGQLGQLPQLLQENGQAKPVLFETTKTRSLLNIKAIFFLLLALLSLEWFLRRYFGGY